jgi:hypothetical protein
MILKLFEMIATGRIRKNEALAHLTALGLSSKRGGKLNQRTVARLFSNKLYCGRMFVKE